MLEAVEICAGAGGQALGLEQAGFEHALAVELDGHACNTLRANRPAWKVAVGDVADAAVWQPASYEGVALLARGVPCPPFTVAGKQLGAAESATGSPGRWNCVARSCPVRSCWRTCEG